MELYFYSQQEIDNKSLNDGLYSLKFVLFAPQHEFEVNE